MIPLIASVVLAWPTVAPGQVVCEPDPTAVEQPALLTTTTLDVLRQRVADKLRGQAIGTWFDGVQGTFSSSFSASDVIIQSVTDAQRGDVHWEVRRSAPGRPQAMTYVTWPNYTNNVGQFSQTLSHGYTSTHEWSTSTTIDVGMSVSVSVGIPDEASMSATVSEDISVTDSRSESQSVTQDQSFNITQPVPPDSVLYAAVVVTPLTVEADWSATIVVDGYGFVRGNLGVPLPMQLSTFLTEAERTFQVSGTYSGEVGTDFHPCTETYAVDSPRPGRCP